MPFTDEPEVKRIVINGRFGWFGLSDNAHFNLGSLKRDGSSTLSSAWELPMHLRDLSELDFRSHPDLLAVVDNLGRDADGRSAYLYVVEVPIEFDDDIHIAEYDGREHIAQNHRRWS